MESKQINYLPKIEIFNKQLKPKSVGLLMLIPSVLTLLLSVFGLILLTAFGLGSGGNLFMLIPFFFVSFISLLLCCIGIYIGFRYIKGNGFKKNRSLGILILVLGNIYFVSTSLSFLLSNLTGNSGGYLQPIIAFIFLLGTFPLGLALKNGTK